MQISVYSRRLIAVAADVEDSIVLWTASRSFMVGSVLINCVTVMKFLRQDT